MKTISIIIPCYNVEKYIDRCLKSLEKQTVGMDCLEIICLDDKSTDSTLSKLHEWERRYPDNICIVELPDNGRQGRARNIGLEYASCEWIAFIDSDDWVEPVYFEKMCEAAGIGECGAARKHSAGDAYVKNSTGDYVDIVCCKAGRDASEELSFWDQATYSDMVADTYAGATGGNVTSENKFQDKIKYMDIDSDNKRRELSILASLAFIAYCKLIRRDFLIEHDIRFAEYMAYEDIYWGSLLPYYVSRVCFVDEILYHYFVNPASTVLVNNASYHPDMLTVNLMLWEEYKRRGLFEKYEDEIVYNFIYTCYLAFIKVLALRYSEPQYSLFMLLQELAKERIPDWKHNRYIMNGDIKDYHMIFLELIDKDVNKEDFAQILEIIRKSGI